MSTRSILDSVHGYIEFPIKYFDNIIDTFEFQSLRRVEQTSVRAIFPTSKHDRFMHSLGVYHVGTIILKSVEENHLEEEEDNFPQCKETVFESYRLACLLHDVAHSPFSHLFEDFFNYDDRLDGLLIDEVKSQSFEDDFKNSDYPGASHEKMSALLSHKRFWKVIDDFKGDPELVVRMIIGCTYEGNNEEESFKNCFIELIHGDVIDADRVDYVCRDSWSAGYHSATVDLYRLIKSIKVFKDINGLYKLCYSSKSLPEIDSVLQVKDFQQRQLITHRTVVYDSHLLIEAMKAVAERYYKKGEESIYSLCDVNSLWQDVEIPGTGIKLLRPIDDDFVALMKLNKDDDYVKQWLSRDYALKALWKTSAEFYAIFDFLRGKNYLDNMWLFTDKCKEFLANVCNTEVKNIWIIKATPKEKKNYYKNINLFVKGKVYKYTELYPKANEDIHNVPFYYIYVPKNCNIDLVLEKLKEEVKEKAF